jgi:hypothetical protein
MADYVSRIEDRLLLWSRLLSVRRMVPTDDPSWPPPGPTMSRRTRTGVLLVGQHPTHAVWKRRNDLDPRSSSINQSIWQFVYGSVRQWRTAEGLEGSSNGYCLLVYKAALPVIAN